MEVDRLLADIELKISNITGKPIGATGSGESEGTMSLRKQVHILNAMTMLLQQMTGDKNVNAAIQKIQQLVMLLMRARMLLFAVTEAEAGALGPFGWLYAGANAVIFATSFTDVTGYDAARGNY